MNITSKLVPLLVILLATCILEGLSIKCWDCRSDSEPKCADPFENSTVQITNCGEEAGLSHLRNGRLSMCRKTIQKVDGEWITFRGCSNIGEPGVAGDGVFMEYYTCNSKDGCNTGTAIHSNNFILLIGGFLAWFIGRICNSI